LKQITTLPVITVSNSRSNYEGGFTKEEEALIQSWTAGYTVSLFCGMCEIGDERIDLNDETVYTALLDVFEYIANPAYPLQHPNTILLDPPYNERYATKYAKHCKTPSDFVIFADVQRTNQLFNWIKAQQPAQIILKSFQFYRFEGYEVKGVITYAGGYRRPIFLLCNYRSETNKQPVLQYASENAQEQAIIEEEEVFF
jgi:hypothetical protein